MTPLTVLIDWWWADTPARSSPRQADEAHKNGVPYARVPGVLMAVPLRLNPRLIRYNRGGIIDFGGRVIFRAEMAARKKAGRLFSQKRERGMGE